ncbi:tryptophan--tRNA ligase [Chiayiivirga flava]|uniref:Tryptophan--tRNA ligase n=1 Tax=Chiayiivirga flava TaxID=659595 RepID=A0A7W8G1T0_9GAMM|nr:tryptophan--tRNA ligase [Chiayiivirga flava]MBB5209198.1 tryptophanyl-tRNA synthetase [Chiayiivirga flava]
MSSKTRVLTGITTTGTPHLGNYVGAIRPAVAASRDANVDAFYFLADYHALIKCDDPARIERSRLEIAATWLAAGLDPERVTFYRQSDIPEIPELTWLLTCVTAKGLMNRSHAYKAAIDANLDAGEDADAGVTMGLFSYPILMAADILMFNAHKVPVGRDQIQHIEMARDIAARFNHLFGNGREFFVLPEAAIEESVATLPGLDGRKMSKSYDNTIPLFDGGAKRMKDTIARIVTDSKLPGEAKDPDSTALTTIYAAFAGADELAAFRAALVDGLGWGEAKKQLFGRIERDVAPMRERYDALIAKPADIEDLLQVGARKARAIAAPALATLREAVGLRKFVALTPDEAVVLRGRQLTQAGRTWNTNTVSLNYLEVVKGKPKFKQYRDADGRFYFKFFDGDGRLLLQSDGFASPKDAGQRIAQLKAAAAFALQPGETPGEGVQPNEIEAALAVLAAE